MASALSKRMSLRAFENGYWYQTELVEFGKNRVTKGFIRREATRKNPGIREKSGVWYRRSRWREAHVAKRTVTYGELIDQYMSLNRLERFEQIRQGTYINFLADYFAAEKDASRENAIAAWKKLKKMDVPKTY